MAALAIATDRFPDATEYEAMRQRILKASAVTVETPDREMMHISDRKEGDTSDVCWHEYAGHEGPCVGSAGRWDDA